MAVPKGRYSADLQLAASPLPVQWYTMLSNCEDVRRPPLHPRFFDENLGLVVGAIHYVRGCEN